jgi:hypothetical protein
MENLRAQTTNEENSLAKGILIKRPLMSISFGAVLVFFFFSFVDFRCNGVTVASPTGYNLVFGKHLKEATPGFGEYTNAFDQFSNNPTNRDSNVGQSGDSTIKPNIWAILGLVSAIIGLIIFLKADVKNENRWGFVLGIVGMISLILLAIVIENKARTQAGNIAAVDVKFRGGYWLSLLAFALATASAHMRRRHKVHDQIGAPPVFSKLSVFISSSVVSKEGKQ